MNKQIKIAATVSLLAITASASAFWGNGNNNVGQLDGTGIADGSANFSMNFSGQSQASGNSYGRGYNGRGYNDSGYLDGVADGSANFNMGFSAKTQASGHGYGRGNNQNYYGYAPYGYVPAPVAAPVVPKAAAEVEKKS